MNTAVSINDVIIRLTDERWFHITEGHPEIERYHSEILDTVEKPDAVFKGSKGELLAVKPVEKGKYLVVVYKESTDKDGFVITAFHTKKKNNIERRKKIWP